MPTLPKTILAAALCLGLTLPATAAKEDFSRENAEGKSMAVYLLEQLNEREQQAYEKYETAIEKTDIDQIRRELQSVIDGYDRLITQAPEFAPAYVSYGLLLNRTGNREESYAMFLKADELDPMVAVVKNQLGNYMAEEGKYAEAYGFFLLARDLAPHEALYDYQIGNLLVGYRKHFIADELYDPQGIDQQIIEHFHTAMQKAPDDLSYAMRYAQSFFDVQHTDWVEALEAWQKLYKKAGSEYEQQVVRLYTARVRFELGHHTAARKLLKQIDHPSLDQSKAKLLDAINGKHPQ